MIKRSLFFVFESIGRILSLRKPIIKRRYIKTRTGKLRARYIFLALMAIIGVSLSMGASDINKSIAWLPTFQDDDTLAGNQPRNSFTRFWNQNGEDSGGESANNLSADPNAPQIAMAPPAGLKPRIFEPKEIIKTVKLEKGGTLGGLLAKEGIGGNDAYNAIQVMKKDLDPTDLRAGQAVDLHLFQKSEDSFDFLGFDIKKSGIELVKVRKNDDENFSVSVDKKEVIAETRAAEITVKNSLYADLTKAGVPDGIINQLIKTYSWAIDFQRDIWGGEDVKLLYTVRVSKDGEYMRSNQLLFAQITMRGKERPIYRFKRKDGLEDFYDHKGRSVRKALLKTPVDGARLSSGFGMRKHPVLGYSKMHKGLDFAAPRGTPIYAAGKGVINKKYRSSSYGNYIRIRHNDKYQTAYAHMQKFAKGLKDGSRVQQGQVIGYVGSTGRSTGPHLHYEVIVNGKQVNPHSVTLPIGETLSKTNLANFKKKKAAYDDQFKKVLKTMPPEAFSSAAANSSEPSDQTER